MNQAPSPYPTDTVLLVLSWHLHEGSEPIHEDTTRPIIRRELLDHIARVTITRNDATRSWGRQGR